MDPMFPAGLPFLVRKILEFKAFRAFGKNFFQQFSRSFPGTFLQLRDGETTIKIKFSLFEGRGLGGREENRPKMLVFVGNATTIKF